MDTSLQNLKHSFPANPTQAWYEQINKELKGESWENALTHRSADGILIKPVYTRADNPTFGRARNYAGWMLRRDISFQGLEPTILKIDQLKIKGVNYFGLCFSDPVVIKDIQSILAAASMPVVLEFQYAVEQGFLEQLATIENRHGITLKFKDLPTDLFELSEKLFSNKALWYTQCLRSEATTPLEQLTDIGIQGAVLFQKCKDIDKIASSTVLELSIEDDFFMAIAKIRSMRLIWANVVKAFHGLADSRNTFIHVKCTGTQALETEPYRWLISNSNQALAAVLGGADTLQLEHLSIEGQEDMLENVAAGVSHLLMHESHLDKTADPAHGSYYIEYLTHEMVNLSWNHICKHLNHQV